MCDAIGHAAMAGRDPPYGPARFSLHRQTLIV